MNPIAKAMRLWNTVRWLKPVLAGDTISVSAQVKEVYAKTGRTGTMVFAVTKFTYRNQHGRTVANTESSTVHRQVER